jgi:AraC-like DNA-binding protein
MKRIIREITPINNDDFFVLLNHPNAGFDFPIHYHYEYELNLATYFEGKRIVGDSIEEVKGPDLVLIGPNTFQRWESAPDFRTHLITIQFSPDLFGNSFINKNLFKPIKTLLELSTRGIVFSKEEQTKMIPKIISLTETKGFDSVIKFLSILNDLALSTGRNLLCSSNFTQEPYEMKSRRIKTIHQYLQKNYSKKITIEEMAALINMSESGFCHFFKKRTQKSFVEYLNDLRIGEASRMLLETTNTISEISFNCGFNNISNFNRIFKKKKGVIPSLFRDNNINKITIY